MSESIFVPIFDEETIRIEALQQRAEAAEAEAAELRETLTITGGKLAAARLKTDEACKAVQATFKRNSRLEQQLTTQAAEASAACQEWDARCQELEQRLAVVQEAINERDAELVLLRNALDTLPLYEYGDAQREGCDAKGAWDCFREALEEHVTAVRSAPAVYDAIRAWRDDGEGREERGGESDD